MIKSRRMKWAGYVACMGTKRNAYGISVGKPEEKRRRRKDNIRMDLRDVGWSDIYWINLAQDRDQWKALVNTVSNMRFARNVGKFCSSWATDGFSRRALLHGVGYFLKEKDVY
jgi:hypothetical protein